MTWLSRLLPQSGSRQQLANHNRTRQAQRRRRMATLETLEGRTLLSNVTVTQLGGVVTIAGDTHSDSFQIVETGNSKITVNGTNSSTTINSVPGTNNLGVSVPRFGVTSIDVILPGSGNPKSSNIDNVLLTQTGSPSGISNVLINGSGSSTGGSSQILTVTVNGVVNTGSFTVNDGTSTTAGGKLTATVTGSHFTALSIYQTGCCPASVDLENDTVSGAVSVTEGLENGDSIVLNNDHFGLTSLTQGAGPETLNGNLGANDTVSVNDSTLTNLAITQPLGTGTDLKGNTVPNGANDSITVGNLSPVEVAASVVGVGSGTFAGISATQGDGANDTILIESISSLGKPSNNSRAVLDSIITRQGNGDNDSTIVDSAGVVGAPIYGNIESSQGNGNFDSVAFYGNVVGTYVVNGIQITETGGLEQITQGDGYNDTATVDCGLLENVGAQNIANNVAIYQGDSLFPATPPPNCPPGLGDVANVNCSTITSDLTIHQGVNGASVGNNIVNVATTMPVTVGDATDINEIGANNGNNTITLGGFTGPNSGSVDFETGYLDVYTGAAGGATVTVSNTVVDTGAQGLYGPYNINGDGDGNTATIDTNSFLGVLGGAGVTAEPLNATPAGFVISIV